MKNIIFVFAIVLFISCKGNKENEIYIPKDKFIDLLADIHLADAFYATHYEQRKVHSDSINYYNKILKDYGFTKAQFDTTVKYYSVHSEEFDMIYEEVITNLSKTVQENYSIRPVEAELSKDIWRGKNFWYLPEEGSQKKIPISLELKGKGKYVVTFIYKMYTDDESKKPHINLYLSNNNKSKPKKDTIKTVNYEKSNRTAIITLTKELKDSTLTHLNGFLLDHENKKGDWKKHVIIEGLKVYYIPKK